MYDPMNPPVAGIPADPLPDDLPEGDSGEVTDDGVEEPVFDPYYSDVEVTDRDTLEAALVAAVEIVSDDNQETNDDA